MSEEDKTPEPSAFDTWWSHMRECLSLYTCEMAAKEAWDYRQKEIDSIYSKYVKNMFPNEKLQIAINGLIVIANMTHKKDLGTQFYAIHILEEIEKYIGDWGGSP